jgi:hypothetical protein
MTISLSIPVSLGQCRAGAVDDFAGCPPVASVHIAADSHWDTSKGSLPEHNGKIYLALIDTGAESTFIDAAVAAEIDAKPTRYAKVHGIGEPSAAQGTDIQVIFPGSNLVFKESAAIQDFRGSGNAWGLVLGRSFLQHCRFLLDGPNATYQLHWIG